MSQTIEQQKMPIKIEQVDTEHCFCERKTCAIGIASIAIGIGGFVLANLL